MATLPRFTRPDRVALRKVIQRQPGVRSLLVSGVVQYKMMTTAQATRAETVLAQAPSLEGAAERLVERHGLSALTKIKSIWQVDTGLTKDAWALEGSGLRRILANPIVYSQWVHRKGETTALVAAQGDVTKIVVQAQKNLAADLRSLFALVLQKVRDAREARDRTTSRPATTGVLSRIRRFFGG